MHVRGFSRGVGGERAAPLLHDAKAAKDEDLGLATDLARNRSDFGHAQHSGQNDPARSERLHIEVDCIRIGSGGLNRNMKALVRITLRRIVENADVGDNQSICARLDSIVDRAFPDVERSRSRERVNGNQNLNVIFVGMRDPRPQFFAAEIKPGKIARIGLVAKAAIDRIRPCFNGGLECGWRSGGTDQFHDPPSDARSLRCCPGGSPMTPRTSRSTTGDNGPIHATDSATMSIPASSIALRSATAASISPSI